MKPSMSAFIKLHPHSLVCHQVGEDQYSADLSFSVEQYGLMVRDCVVKLQLFPPNAFHSHWWLVCEDPARLRIPGFAVFLRSLESHVFARMQYSPAEAIETASNPGQLRGVGGASGSCELFFEKMYFDIQQMAFHLDEPKETQTKG